MLSIYKRRVSLALKIDTIARLDAKAEADNTSRNDVAEYLLSASLSKIMLSEEAQAKVQAEIDANRKARKGL
jgi:hypothetical protein